ncbi:MAG: caspase family protein, partial [Proteobacteria bacterium]|nr:caspase family protein [Pseudomonadota bacterium]
MLAGLRRVAAVLTLSLAFCAAAAAQGQESRVALVIGNGTYQKAEALRNPVNDAHGMAAALRSFGFDVIVKENAGRRAMIEGLREFAGKLAPGGVGLFFYAGHGLQAKGANYLVPVDAVLTAEDDLRYEAVDVNDVLGRMEEARVQLSLVILDACRDNPFLRGSRSVARGMAQIDAARGTFIAYATAPGKTAADGDGENGLYTAELLRSLKEPGLTLEDVFKRTLDGVDRKSAGQQTPWTSSSFRGRFIFNAVAPPAPAAMPPAKPQAATPPSAPRGGDPAEATAWKAAANSNNTAVLESFLRDFPSSAYAGPARNRLASLMQGQAVTMEPIERAYVATGIARLREGPSLQAKQVAALREGQVVQVLGKVKGEDWYLVEQEGKPGAYVAVGLLEELQAYRKRNPTFGQQYKDIPKEQSRLRLKVPGLESGREIYWWRPSPDDSTLEMFYSALFPQQGAYPRAQVWLHILAPGHVRPVTGDLDEAWLRKQSSFFKDKTDLAVTSVARGGNQEMRRTMRFTVDGAACFGFNERFGEFSTGPLAVGFYCAGLGEALTEARVSAVLAGVMIDTEPPRPQQAAVTPSVAPPKQPSAPPPSAAPPQQPTAQQYRNITRAESRLHLALPGLDKASSRYQWRPPPEPTATEI